MNADEAYFDVHFMAEDGDILVWEQLHLSVPGRHNVLNSLAAITIAWKLGVTEDAVRQGLKGFAGVKRRFTTTGISRGVRVIDDNARNPAQIAATSSAAHDVQSGTPGKVVAVIQPSRYSHLRDMLQDYCSSLEDPDVVIVADINASRELPIDGINKNTLVDALRHSGHLEALALPAASDLAALVAERTQPGDLVVYLGARVSEMAHALPGQLDNIF